MIKRPKFLRIRSFSFNELILSKLIKTRRPAEERKTKPFKRLRIDDLNVVQISANKGDKLIII